MGSLGVVPNFGQIYNPDSFTGNGSTTTFTLSNLVTSDQSIIWIESGVTQKPGIDYTISGLTLTRTTAPANGVACFAMYLGVSVDVGTIGDSSVTLAKMAGGIGGALSLDASPDTDHTANGPQTNTLAAGYSSTIMDLVYLGSGSKWLEADSDATGTAINLLGIALEAKTDTQAMNVALPGSFVRDDSWSWTPGVPLYMSGTLGAITATKPTGTGDVVRTVGYAVHADYIFFAPSSDYVTLV